MIRSKVEQDLSCDVWCTRKLFFSNFGPSTDTDIRIRDANTIYLSVCQKRTLPPKIKKTPYPGYAWDTLTDGTPQSQLVKSFVQSSGL